MIQPDSKPSVSSRTSDDWSDLCALYLLGELDREQCLSFEQKLAESPSRAQTLLRQAECIHLLSVPSTNATSLRGNKAASSGWLLRRVCVAALAACVAWILFSLNTDQGARLNVATLPAANGMEELLIAKAWVDQSLGIDPKDESTVLYEGEFVEGVEEADVDSTLSWMFVAIATDLELQDKVGPNDG